MGPPVKVSVLARQPYCSCEHRLCSPGAQRSRRASRAASPFALLSPTGYASTSCSLNSVLYRRWRCTPMTTSSRPPQRSIRTPRSAHFERFIPDCAQFSPVANNTKGPANGSPAELKPLTIGLQYSRALMQNRALLNQNEESALYLVRRGGAMSLLSAPPCRSPAYVFAW